MGTPLLGGLLKGTESGPNGVDGGADVSITVPLASLAKASIWGAQISFNAQMAGLYGIGAYGGAGTSHTLIASNEALPVGVSDDEGLILLGGAGEGYGSTLAAQISDSDHNVSAKVNVDEGGGAGAFIAVGKYFSKSFAFPALGC